MAAQDDKKLRNPLQLLRGGLWLGPRASPELALDREIRTNVVQLVREGDEPVRDRNLANICGDRTHPTRVLTRPMRALHGKGKRLAQVHAALVVPQIRFLHRLYGRVFNTGEFLLAEDGEVRDVA